MGSYTYRPTSSDIDNTNTQAIVGPLVTNFPTIVGGTDRQVVITDKLVETYMSTGTQDTSLGFTVVPASFLPPGATNIRVFLTAIVSLSQPLGDPTDISDLRLGVWHVFPAGPVNYLRILHWNDPLPTQYSAEMQALVGTGGSNDPTPWTYANIPNHVFLVRAKASAVDSPGFNIHEVSLDFTWADPTLGPASTPIFLGSTATSATLRCPLSGSTLPAASTDVPIEQVLFYGLTPDTTRMSSQTIRTITETSGGAPTLSNRDAVAFTDGTIESLTPNTQYFAFVRLQQDNLPNADSAIMTFNTASSVVPVFGI